jgi:hypothetical protein
MLNGLSVTKLSVKLLNRPKSYEVLINVVDMIRYCITHRTITKHMKNKGKR